MSLSAMKPFNYPIVINVKVTKSIPINNDNWLFNIQLTSNITTWEITPTLFEFEMLHNKLQYCRTLHSMKLPQCISQITGTQFKSHHKQIVENYLLKLLRRAYIFISLPVQKFIQSPFIMQQKTDYLSKQLNIIIREDNILLAIQNKNKYIETQCILRSSYILDVYTIPNNNIKKTFTNNDKNIPDQMQLQLTLQSKQLLFRIDVVYIKRVVYHQKEYKLVIETRNGIICTFKCKNKKQLNDWLHDIKNMIKAEGGCTPFLSKFDRKLTAGRMNICKDTTACTVGDLLYNPDGTKMERNEVKRSKPWTTRRVIPAVVCNYYKWNCNYKDVGNLVLRKWNCKINKLANTYVDNEISKLFYSSLSKEIYKIIDIIKIKTKKNKIYEQIIRTKCQTTGKIRSSIEKHLWHGSKNINNLKLIYKNGFDRSYNIRQQYGSGTYFALSSSYSVNGGYCGKDKNGVSYILLCKVIVGDYLVGNRSMKQIPRKPNGQEYDCLVNRELNPTVFVVWRDYHAIPCYLVKFR